MPGPMAAWARSTGAMLLVCSSARAGRKLRSERVEKFAAGRRRGSRRPSTTDENDTGGEGVGAHSPNAIGELGSNRPCSGNGKTGADHCIEKGLPACRGGAAVTLRLGLFEGVVDGYGEGRMRRGGNSSESATHAFYKESFCVLLSAVTVRSGDQLLVLGHDERGEKVGKDRSKRPPQPDVEEVGQVGIADIVVVRRVGRDELVRACRLSRRVFSDP